MYVHSDVITEKSFANELFDFEIILTGHCAEDQKEKMISACYIDIRIEI